MYAQYWGLVDTPFANHVDGRWFYDSPLHEEALARLLFLIEQHRRCGVLFGAAGTGKSMLLHVLARQVRRSQRQLAVIDLLGRTGHELLWELAGCFGLPARAADSSAVLWRTLQDHLRGNQSAAMQTVILLDHAERADSDCWRCLDRLIHFQNRADQWTTIVLAIRSENLGQYASRLREFCDLRVEVPPLDMEQCRLYVEHLLAKAGATGPIFEPAALERIHELSEGLPREINRLCDLALLAAMADGDRQVTERLVTYAAEDIQTLGRHDNRPAYVATR